MKYLKKKEKKAKDPLLQTYFISLFSLVLCVAMFMGTTFAWFSSDVSSADNQIYVGTLSVALSQMKDGAYTPITQTAPVAEGQENPNAILPDSIRWEPGYTFVKWLKLENTGDLSFRYRLKMASADPNNVLGTIGTYFTVYANTATTYEAYSQNIPATIQALQEDANWVKVGTLADVMKGKSIVSGQMEKGKAAEFAFAIHMEAAAGQDAMGQKLEGITVKLEAWQATAESDSLGGDYDNFVTTAEELEAAIKAGGKVILAENMELEETITLGQNTSVELDLNGKTLSNAGMTEGRMFRLGSGSGLTINAENSTVELGGWGLVEFPQGSVQNATLTLNGGTYTSEDLDNGALIRLRAGNENLTVNLNDVTVELTDGWLISTEGVTADNAMTLNVQGGSFKADKGFQLGGTTAQISGAKIESISWAILSRDATVTDTDIVVTGAGTVAGDDTPAGVGVMHEGTLAMTDCTVKVKGAAGAAALVICSSGGHLVLEGVDVTTEEPVVLFDNTAEGTGKPSSVSAKDVTHNGAAAVLGQ